jgi:hypothetical protein
MVPSRLIVIQVIHVVVSFIATLLLRSLLVLPVTFDPTSHFFGPDYVV